MGTPLQGPTFKGATTNSHLGVSYLDAAKPAAAAAGDVLFTLVTVNHDAGSAITVPAGWRRECWQGYSGTPSIVLGVFTKVVGGSEPASTRWHVPPNSGATVAVLAYGGVDPDVRLQSCEGATVLNSASVTAPAVATATANSRVLGAYAIRGAGTFTAPAGTTERFDLATASDTARSVSTSLVDQFRASAGNVPAATATASLTSPAAVSLRFALPPAPGTTLFSDSFSQPNGLISNEWAKVNPTDPAAVTSPDWIVTSGSIFCHDGRAWTGKPDRIGPDPTSSNGTNSAVLRVITRRPDFENVGVSFSLWNWGLLADRATDWDGAHVFLRYKSPDLTYFVSINRRDNTVVIKKEVGDQDYHVLSPVVAHTVPYGQKQSIVATVQTLDDSSVKLTLSAGGRVLVEGVDDGSKGGLPIYGPGPAGIRGDNANLEVDDFSIVHLG